MYYFTPPWSHLGIILVLAKVRLALLEGGVTEANILTPALNLSCAKPRLAGDKRYILGQEAALGHPLQHHGLKQGNAGIVESWHGSRFGCAGPPTFYYIDTRGPHPVFGLVWFAGAGGPSRRWRAPARVAPRWRRTPPPTRPRTGRCMRSGCGRLRRRRRRGRTPRA